jgi:hypothetical protein
LHTIYEQEDGSANEVREAAETFLQNIRGKTDVDFAEAAQAAGAEIRTYRLAGGNAFDSDGKQKFLFSRNAQSDAEAVRRLEFTARGAKPGGLLGISVRTSEGHMVARRAVEQDEGSGDLLIDAAFFRRQQFDDWLAEQVTQVRICIHDEFLRQRYEADGVSIKLNCSKR